MILEIDFQIHVDYDESGLIVRVTHKPTGIVCDTRPDSGETVKAVKDKLLTQVQNLIYNPDDFEFHIGLCKEASDSQGQSRTFLSVTHLPTGKSRSTLGQVNMKELLDD
jgi:hypothetical protein